MAHHITIKAGFASFLILFAGFMANMDTAEAAKAKSTKNERYVVKKGDTLWDIAKRFLNDPWLWPEVWHINPKIRNPHLIYPGDVVLLYYVDGKPYLTLEGKAGVPVQKDGIKTMKLSPQARVQPLSRAITTIPREVIEPFLKHATVLDRDRFDRLPHIISSFEEHLVAGRGNRIYAANVESETIGTYTVVRPGKPYRDPDSQSILGYEAEHVATARVTRVDGKVTTLDVSESWQEVHNGDRLIPYEDTKSDFYFYPRAPKDEIKGKIVSVFGGVTMIGQYSVVVINKGERDGMVPGHVLAISQAGATVRDVTTRQPVKLPDERAGFLMIFKIFNRVSLGLVLETQRTLSVGDKVENP
ncbi:MAG: LysM peptidoglycan-binding domain-containing protein [Gammaproteobacteria bacterium]|nr:LysM peptidoglycan-binding domain-containing protein [Gammaproteobacteria bacterium]